jgi:hypothetical protein
VYARKFNADGTAATGEIIVDNRTGNQYQPAVAAFDDGSFLVVYRNDVVAQGDGSGATILGQYYDASGNTVGSRFVVNTTTSSDQHDAQALTLSGNKVLVSYRMSDGSSNGVYGKIYDSAGNVLKNEFRLNTTTSSDQAHHEFRSLADGGFILTYASADAGGNYRILAQRYDNNGDVVGSELQLGSYSANMRQHFGTIVQLSSGDLVFSWQKTSNNTAATMTDDKIFFQRFSLSGSNYIQETDIVELDHFTQVGSLNPRLAPLAAGGHVVVWRNLGFEPSGSTTWGVLAQIFDSNGSAIGPAFSLAQTNQGNHQYDPVVVGTPDGGFIAAWHSDGVGGDSSGTGVRVAKYSSTGSILTSELLANTFTTGTQTSPEVAVASDGSFVVTWRSDYQTVDPGIHDVYMQRFDASGNKVGSETLVNSVTNGAQYMQKVAINSSGLTMITWASTVGDSSGWGVLAKIYDAAGNVVVSDFLVNTGFQNNSQYGPSVAVLNDGRFAITWMSYGEDGSRWSVVARIINTDGSFATGHLQVNQWTPADQHTPDIQALSNGGYAVTWLGSGEGQSYAVWGRLFDSNGTATTNEFRVSDIANGWGVNPKVTQRSDNSLIFAWTAYDPTAGSVLQQRVYSPGLLASTPPEAIIGQVVATDADPNETFSYQIIAADTNDFELIGSYLVVKDGAVFDPVNDPPRHVTIRVTDSVGNTFDKQFVINPSPVNQAPSSLTFTPVVIAENSANGTAVGTAVASDPDAGDTLTYELVVNAGGRFTIDANTGVVTVANSTLIDFDSAASHSITVKATDQGGLAIIQAYTVSLSNVNEAATAIVAAGPGANLVTNGSFESALTGWTSSGTVASGPSFNPSDGTTQAIFNTGGGANNGVLSQVITTVVGQTYTVLFDFTAAGATPPQTLRFEAIGSNTLVNSSIVTAAGNPVDHRTYAYTFVADSTSTTIRFSDIASNSASTDMVLDHVRMYAGLPSVAENSVAGTVVSRLGSNDPDANDDVTFTLVGGDTTNFEIVGNEIRVKAGASLNHEPQSSHTVTVRATDEGGLTHDQVDHNLDHQRQRNAYRFASHRCRRRVRL